MRLDLSIIVVSFNTIKLLRRCLTSVFDSLYSADLNYEVILVDNASIDGSIEMVKREFPQVRLIENKKNFGFGKANNQAVEKAEGKYLFFLNSDVEVLNKSVEKLYKFAVNQWSASQGLPVDSEKELHQYGIYGGKLFNTDKRPQPSCGYFYSLPIVFFSLFLKGDQLHLTRFSPDKVIETDWVSGACLLIKKDLFENLGGFDESIFMYMDEVDLCFRAKKKGYSVIFYPEAKFIHVGSASSKDRREPYINLFRGLVYFYQKHWQGKLWLLKIMLKLKAHIAITVGKVLGNRSLVENYGKALQILELKK